MKNHFALVDVTDSFVLGFERHDSDFWIRALLSLQPGHIAYSKPTGKDYSCYRHCWIKILGVSAEKFHWIFRSVSADPSGEVDFGSIEAVKAQDGIFSCDGEWGSVTMACAKVELLFDPVSRA